MDIKEQVTERISLLPIEQVKKVADFLDSLSSPKKNTKKVKLSKSQKKALDLLNYTIDTGRTDFARNLDKYLYGKKK